MRGDKLFMLATECARVLGYRDSYLLFNKNRSLYKIIANQNEKDDLVSQEILPFSYRSRQIAIVTARSMFRQFGSRVIVSGRRVRDDYWETKARKQGFTEADLAGEKRPGASKAREAAAEANQSAALLGGPHGEIVYSNTPSQFGGPQPSIPGKSGMPRQKVPGHPRDNHSAADYSDTTRSRDYSAIMKTGPRQELSGPAYQDRSQAAPVSELHAQAHHAAEFNRTVNQQRDMRAEYMQNMWRRPHEQPPGTAIAGQLGSTDASVPPASRPAPSSHTAATAMQQPSMVPNQSPQQQMMMTAAPYSQPVPAQNPVQSSIRGMAPNPSPRPTKPTGIPVGSTAAMPQTQGYNYQTSAPMWQGGPSAQYSYTHPSQAQPSPHQPQPSPSQLRHSAGNAQVQPGGMPYSGIPGMSQGFPSQAQGMPFDQTPRQYLHQGGASAPAVTQGWSGQQQAPAQWWANQQQQ